MEYSPELDEEIFDAVDFARENGIGKLDLDTADEIVAIAKKWRSKAIMRQVRIEELEEEMERDRATRAEI